MAPNGFLGRVSRSGVSVGCLGQRPRFRHPAPRPHTLGPHSWPASVGCPLVGNTPGESTTADRSVPGSSSLRVVWTSWPRSRFRSERSRSTPASDPLTVGRVAGRILSGEFRRAVGSVARMTSDRLDVKDQPRPSGPSAGGRVGRPSGRPTRRNSAGRDLSGRGRDPRRACASCRPSTARRRTGRESLPASACPAIPAA